MPISPVPPRGRKASSPVSESILKVSFRYSCSINRVLSRGNVGAGLRSANIRRPSRVKSGSMCSIIRVPLGEQRGQSAGGDDLHGAAEFSSYPGQQALDQADIPPVHAGLHGRDGGPADHRLRPADADARQAGGGLVKGLKRQVDARADDAAEVGTRTVYHIERGRGTKIDDDQRAAEVPVAGQGVQQAVGADFVRVVDLDLEPPVERGAGDQRLDGEPVPAQPAQVIQRGGDDGADDRRVDLLALQVATG